MKKLKYIVFTLLITFLSLGVVNANSLYNLDIDVFINDDGSAHIKEIWDMNVNQGTEVYKPMIIDTDEISNFKVSNESGEYQYVSNWDVNGNISNKAYKNGINYTSNGLELCWGMSSHGNHVYTIEYDIKNFVFNTNDNQVVYWKLINDSMDPAPKHFTIDITSSKPFADTLDVWGYGYKGLAYVSNGKISMTDDNYGFNSNQYAVLLVKFPLGSFQTTYTTKYESFEDTYDAAEEGTFEHDYEDKFTFSDFIAILSVLISTVIPFIVVVFALKKSGFSLSDYDFSQVSKKINMKEINNFRDIPCKKDMYRAYWCAEVFDLNKKKEDFLGSILLKWLLYDQITLITVPKKLFRKETTAVDLKNVKTFDNEYERKIYNMMFTASKDGILETRELEKWCKSNYSKYFDWFKDTLEYERDLLVNENLLLPYEKGKIFKSTAYTITPRIKEEAVELAGLKKYLNEFTLTKEKSAIEVKMWREYLIYAQTLGIADKVAKQFKDLYPEIFEQSQFNYTDFVIINNISRSGLTSASSARSAAESYSAGGGGFSSGGGGGGSFGGGSGGGCR